MKPKAIFLGAIGTVVDTSDLQRQAFNAAFERAGLDWSWDWPVYEKLLAVVGGKNRIAAYAQERGQDVDVAALHAAKSEIFQTRMRREGLSPRPGVAELIGSAKAQRIPLAWVTTTSRENIDAALDALGGKVSAHDFDLIVDRSMVNNPKPDPECYRLAMRELNVSPGDVVAVEDTPESLQAARRAGASCVAFPGAVPPGSTWDASDAIVENVGHLLDEVLVE
ncbi:HAD-IA family hydrolase [uncultured Roseobacter sp.]|uniref:HAD family hydrolase n=1 Tax=uncultured Roseobacter sp. TaxID=114847 RepID=UPI00260A3EFC|nr:HAD-IA family hydrolase [uncultured Roseobacter sp.]